MRGEHTDTKPRGTTSTLLHNVAEHAARAGSITIEEMLTVMGNSSIAFTILILSLPALAPLPGPFGMVFGSCLAIISLQITVGAEHLQLPQFVGKRRLSAATVILIVRYTAPMIARVERVLRPDRLRTLAGRKAQMMLGIPVFVLAIIIALPIPFGNVLPVLALVIIAGALLERDGLAALIGVGVAIVALGTTAGLIYGVMSATDLLVG
ncbi:MULTISPECIES: exopolysaccharide biosynthesis protein [Phyllobacterium]|jgi:hypothetical protein|uniref:Exopolysaccharide biosynthesis protein n=1 Tax=Phyllobacterium sophorae TaxID=1520277 RepID=A0A2P7BG13_9HYPH|nr:MULTISPECIES: exopolysaccharide biosynthesis protein [Phyllobacterium]PSH65407.1 exopolysaccharide biosynthesis protein [Phyllobacterium sophorae]UXN66525.1 exopolysaccharide biosynthesis protein [Phyllobacterium sp. A18/5-2]